MKRHVLEAQFSEKIKAKQGDVSVETTHSNQLAEIISCFQSLLPGKKTKITANITFSELNIDSLLAAQLCQMLNAKLGSSLQPTVFLFSRNIRELDQYLRSEKKGDAFCAAQVIKNKKYHEDCIVIVALDCIFPGATDFSSFWKNLVVGKDVITEIPLSRWNNADYYGVWGGS